MHASDDAMAILMAFQSPELEILGLTTVFGNASTKDATRNALLLVLIFLSYFDLKFTGPNKFLFVLMHVKAFIFVIYFL